jgi:hypothetical protein
MRPTRFLLAAALLLPCSAAWAQRVVDHVVTIAKPPTYVGPCPTAVEFIATIFVTRPATVSFRWERSDHATGPVQTVHISGAGMGVKTLWHLGGKPGTVIRGAETLHVLSPGDAYSNAAEFTATCR